MARSTLHHLGLGFIRNDQHHASRDLTLLRSRHDRLEIGSATTGKDRNATLHLYLFFSELQHPPYRLRGQ